MIFSTMPFAITLNAYHFAKCGTALDATDHIYLYKQGDTLLLTVFVVKYGRHLFWGA